MEKSAVFFDIDGTLWNYEKYIPDSARLAIKKLRENGHLAFICSGRARAFIQDKDLLSLGFDGIVCSCGCHIEIDGKILYEKIIEKDFAKETIETIRKYGFRPILEGPKNIYMDDNEFGHDDPFGNILRRDVGKDLVSIGGDYYGKWVINKLSCATDVEADKRLECFDWLSNEYSIIAHNDNVCELVPAGHNKATGMMKACELVGIDPKNTYAIGDSENDLDMLEAAGIGIAMGNGTENAKAAADYVTTAFDDDGIYNALKHYNLI
ncbi:Cof-type HAD-IIB family hydrolase [Pseudobutyrivibrio sp.]|uniref:Cof-type HAD-IIB family hydrolase n=1 Tax=Pseudobutyrivibrio sp. TaxID=2014367 RepID=UPI0025FE874E|nr:Cof-type HAD-IIB family hydrolase [Pseudobutyrivibrio sp.]